MMQCRALLKGFLMLSLLSLLGCAASNPVKPVENVNLQQFMGDWYVIACIPTLIEKDVYNAVERYEWIPPNKVATTFTFNQGGPEGPVKRYTPTGYVVPNTGNAVWEMQFIWPFKADYKIVYLDALYQTTVIARDKRDYVWLMSRHPTMDDETYQNMLNVIQNIGYDMSKIVKIQNKH